MITPRLVTYTTPNPTSPGAARWERTVAAWGWDARVLVEPWAGWGGRLKRILAYGDAVFQSEGVTHLVFTDMYDVIALGPPSELEAALDHYGHPAMLMATEAGCWPDGHLAPLYEPRLVNWWYPHSQFVLDLRQPRPAGLGDLADGEDDQRHFHQLYLYRDDGDKPLIVLDRECRVFQSIAHSAPWHQFFRIDAQPKEGWQAPRLYNKLTDSYPLFAHGNGGTDMSFLAPVGA